MRRRSAFSCLGAGGGGGAGFALTAPNGTRSAATMAKARKARDLPVGRDERRASDIAAILLRPMRGAWNAILPIRTAPEWPGMTPPVAL